MRIRTVLVAALVAAGALTALPASSASAASVVTATPTTGLGWRTDVEVRITGAPAGARVFIEQCFDDDDGDTDCMRLGTTVVTDAGKARHTVDVHRHVVGTEQSGDCWRSGITCWLSVGGIPGGTTFPLVFDPTTPPPPPPLVDVDPSTDLAGRQLVAVAIRGLLRDEGLRLKECPPADSGRSCVDVGRGVADTEGRFRAFVTLTRLVGGFPFDCVTDGGCVLRVAHESGDTDVPLTFDPSAPLPPHSTITASPTGNLSEGDPIAVVGHGFAGSDFVVIGECRRGAASIAECGRPVTFAPTASDGSFAATFLAQPTLRLTAGDGTTSTVDCRTGAGGCVLTAATVQDYSTAAMLPLTFSNRDEPSLTIHDWDASEGAGVGYVPVWLSRPSPTPVTVEYVTHHDSARAGTDYVRKRARLVFRPGETFHVLRVALVDDDVAEPTERLRIDIDEADGVHVSVGSAFLRIDDDD